MYDIVIIGAGPAGMSAALYAARGGLKTLMLESIGCGGQMNYTYEIANYPGVDDSPSGEELSSRMRKQAECFGATISNERVKEIENISGDIKTVVTRKNTYETKTIVIATGAAPKKLGTEGEQRYQSTGVSYCATCDGAFFKGQVTCVIGGGNTAFEDALYLSRFSKNVYLINRSQRFRASSFLVNKAMENEKIEILTDTVVEKICGDTTVENLVLKNTNNLTTRELDCSGVFVAIGREPSISFSMDGIDVTEAGFIKTDEFMRTSVNGVYAVGDIRNTPLRQVVTAAADGAIAAVTAINYLNEKQ